jgi:ribosome-associated translation inhibitor RaiA
MKPHTRKLEPAHQRTTLTMEHPLQVTFHNLPHSDALEDDIRERVTKLEGLSERLIGCRVVVDSPHRTQAKGKTYAVRIEMQVPGSEIVVSREPVGEWRVAMNEAFDVAKRRLKEHAAKLRGD